LLGNFGYRSQNGDISAGTETTAEIVAKGGSAHFVRTDVSSMADMEQMARTALGSAAADGPLSRPSPKT
jgi:hypothetical protein